MDTVLKSEDDARADDDIDNTIANYKTDEDND